MIRDPSAPMVPPDRWLWRVPPYGAAWTAQIGSEGHPRVVSLPRLLSAARTFPGAEDPVRVDPPLKLLAKGCLAGSRPCGRVGCPRPRLVCGDARAERGPRGSGMTLGRHGGRRFADRCRKWVGAWSRGRAFSARWRTVLPNCAHRAPKLRAPRAPKAALLSTVRHLGSQAVW